MAVAGDLVRVDPTDVLHFQGPYDKEQVSDITITNLSQGQVAFKVKTVSPLQYCVKPNTGTLPAHDSKVTIKVSSQPLTAIPTLKRVFKIEYIDLREAVDKENPFSHRNQEKIDSVKLEVKYDQPESGDQLVQEVIKTDPSSYIVFSAPQTAVQTCHLVVKNLSSNPVVCSFKSNYTDLVVLYPTTAIIPGNGSHTVEVNLNPLRQQPYGVMTVYIQSISRADAVDRNDFFSEVNRRFIAKRKLVIKLDNDGGPLKPTSSFASKPPALITPDVITFQGSSQFTTFEISNCSRELIGFKVLTSTAQRYLVSPSSGKLSMHERATLRVERRKLDLQPSEVVNDRLKVITRVMHPDVDESNMFPSEHKEMFAEFKINIAFE